MKNLPKLLLSTLVISILTLASSNLFAASDGGGTSEGGSTAIVRNHTILGDFGVGEYYIYADLGYTEQVGTDFGGYTGSGWLSPGASSAILDPTGNAWVAHPNTTDMVISVKGYKNGPYNDKYITAVKLGAGATKDSDGKLRYKFVGGGSETAQWELEDGNILIMTLTRGGSPEIQVAFTVEEGESSSTDTEVYRY